ncbi:MAG: hypothetical protein KatS3mg082_1326 [Nitrospiraceae bacterium]|nr:MAG: hypothetical protein KatS3mg082_1326 [Nitrospiraceae bacterium]
MRTSTLALLTAFLGICVVLAATNPTTDDYLLFLEAKLSEALDRMDQTAPSREQNLIRSVFRMQGKRLIEGLVRPNTVRRNWGLVSLFETQVLDVRVVVLGAVGWFVPIKGVEEATLRLGRAVF